MRYSVILSLAGALVWTSPIAAQKPQAHPIPPVLLNHLYVVLDSETVAAIVASPLITDAEALALVAKAASRIDAGRATLDLGTYPFGGTAPVWTVKATGQFENILRGPIAQPPSRCEIVRLNARSGQLLGIQLFPNERDCA